MAAEKLTALRAWMKKHRLAAYIVPHTNRFQSEFLSPEDERLAWLSGFTGSNGIALVTMNKAALVTDSRYTIQARKEIDTRFWTMIDMVEKRPMDWLAVQLKKNDAVGFDPMLFTVTQSEQWQDKFEKLGMVWQSVVQNPIDLLWKNKPQSPIIPAEIHALKYAGVTKEAKIKQLLARKQSNTKRILISDPELVCWLLNLRGRDVPHVPVLQSLALVEDNGHVTVFTDLKKITPAILRAMGKNIHFLPLQNMEAVLVSKKTVLQLDKSQCPVAIKKLCTDKKIPIIEVTDPCLMLRACKNAVEVRGMELAHQKDAVAFKKFFSWFKKCDFKKNIITEMDIVARLHAFRAEDPDFIDDSFKAICGFAANGAIVHYSATDKTNTRLTNGSLLLLDSGGQYRCGTTDITRTLVVGKPTKEMKKHYTLVYQSLQYLSQTRFPVGTMGGELEAFARRELWQHGLCFGHGVGHGVGSFMNVHEGPNSFSRGNNVPLQPGMILSIEPGVYHEGRFGIRLENLVVVVEDSRAGDMKPMLAFKTLTDVPFDKSLLEK